MPTDHRDVFPKNVVYSYTPDEHDGKWETMEARGSVHPASVYPAFAVLRSKIFIYGGDAGDFDLSKTLSTLSLKGHFEVLSPLSETPSPRRDHQAFVHDEKIYFLGGYVNEINENRGEDYRKRKGSPVYFTNEMIQYDPETNRFRQIFSRGRHLSPRIGSAVAVLGHRVFIHGGHDNLGSLHDFFVLDMKTFELAEIESTGYESRISYHSAISITAKHLLFVGGYTPESQKATNQVKIYDAKSGAWEKERSLSYAIGAGLNLQRAVGFPRKDGIAVL